MKSTLTQSVKNAFPSLVSLNGEAIALANLVVSSGNNSSNPREDAGDISSSSLDLKIFQSVPEYDAETFLKTATKSFEELLKTCKKSIENESQTFFQLLQS
jgi:hypothetical protein